jgi:PAS domain S-box-containing protein
LPYPQKSGYVIVVDGRIVRANKAACRIFNLPIEKLQNSPLADLFHPAERDLIINRISRTITSMKTSGKINKYHILSTSQLIETTAKPIIWQGKKALLGIGKEVCQHSAREENLLKFKNIKGE